MCDTLFFSRDIDWWGHATKKEATIVAAEECAAAIRARAVVQPEGGL